MKLFFHRIFLFLIAPISRLYETIYLVRRFCYKTKIFKAYDFRVPIISIGNLTFGGTGKTPFTIWLGNYLTNENKKIMVMMRGHKGSLEYKYGILHTHKKMGRNPYKYGDEALVLARRLIEASIVVGKNRCENLRYYFESEKPDIVLLDDGHQHLKMRRNFNILLFDSLLDISKYQVPPFGYLREGLSALCDSQFVILGRSNQVSKEKLVELKSMIRKYNKLVPIAEIGYKAAGLFDSGHNQAYNTQELQGRKVICFSGIASPDSFYKMIEDYGCNIIHKESFLDHHYFTLSEAKELLNRAQTEDALLVTTEKDMVKIARIIDDPKLVFLKIDVEFYKNESKLKSLLNDL